MKKSMKNMLKEYHKMGIENCSEQISEAMKNYGNGGRLRVLEFAWYDETTEEEEANLEEARATPQNSDQQQLVDYLDGKISLSKPIIDIWNKETKEKAVNDPLLRKYLRQGNRNVKQLLLQLLIDNPTDREIIDDLVFFHNHQHIFDELIEIYTNACVQETDLNLFERLAKDFFYNTLTYTKEYHVLEDLMVIFADNFEKQQLVAKVIKECKKASTRY